MSDLRALLVGIVGGIIAYYATKGIDRYLARRTIRSRGRQIKQLTGELQLLEKLGVADRALLLFGFQMLFGLMSVGAFGVASSLVLPFLRAAPSDPIPLIQLIVSVTIALLAFYAASVFRKLEDPQPTLTKLHERLRDLEDTDMKTDDAPGAKR